jgi:hypothetical protein
VFGEILAENRAMQEICHQLGFDMRYSIEDGVVEASITLGETEAAPVRDRPC